jgi:hypothetical protein
MRGVVIGSHSFGLLQGQAGPEVADTTVNSKMSI